MPDPSGFNRLYRGARAMGAGALNDLAEFGGLAMGGLGALHALGRGSPRGASPGAGAAFAAGQSQMPGLEWTRGLLEEETQGALAAGVSPLDLDYLRMGQPGFEDVGRLSAIKFMHASPHRFDRPRIDASTFKTGEGTTLESSHGRGLYGSHPESESVHSFYQKSFGERDRLMVGDVPYDPNDMRHLVAWRRQSPMFMGDEAEKKLLLDDIDRLTRELRERSKGDVVYRTDEIEKLQQMLAAWDDPNLPQAHTAVGAPGRSYEGYAPEIDEDELLREDAPFGQQSPKVQERLRGWVDTKYPDDIGLVSPDDLLAMRESEYGKLASRTGAELRADIGEETLFEAGIPGQRFPDHPAKKADRLALSDQSKDVAIKAWDTAGGDSKATAMALRGQVHDLHDQLNVVGPSKQAALVQEMHALEEAIHALDSGWTPREASTFNTVWFPGSEDYIDWKQGPLSDNPGGMLSTATKSWKTGGPLSGGS